MVKRSKRYKKALENLGDAPKSLADAVKALCAMPKAKFDETVEVSFKLNVDPKQSTQMVRGTVRLPHGSGKKVRVVVFTEHADQALAAGADKAGLDDLIKEVEGGWMDFDVAIATTSAMKERESLAVNEAGLTMLMNLLLLLAIPTPPILLLYAVPSLVIFPIPYIEYGENEPYAPLFWLYDDTVGKMQMHNRNILNKILDIIFSR